MSRDNYELKQKEKERAAEKARQRRQIKKAVKVFIIVFAVAAAIFGISWYFSKSPVSPETKDEVVSASGIHWHSTLTVNIFGEEQDIPAGIGLERLAHKPLHTHDRDNVIHMEFEGIVLEKDIRLGKFFDVWQKTFNKNCIFDKCSSSEGKLKMLVNGVENSEFENYVMQDGDKIEIIFE